MSCTESEKKNIELEVYEVFEVWQVGDYILANNLIGSALGRGYVWDMTTIYRKVDYSPCLSKVRPIVDHIIVQTSFKSLHQCHNTAVLAMRRHISIHEPIKERSGMVSG